MKVQIQHALLYKTSVKQPQNLLEALQTMLIHSHYLSALVCVQVFSETS